MPCGRRGTVNAQVRMRSNPAPQPSRVHIRIDIDLTSAGLAWYGGPPPSVLIFACRNHCFGHDPMLEAAKQCSVLSWSTRLYSGRAVRGVRLCRWVWRAHWIGGATLLPHHTNPKHQPHLGASQVLTCLCDLPAAQFRKSMQKPSSHNSIPSPVGLHAGRCRQAGRSSQAWAAARTSSKQASKQRENSSDQSMMDGEPQ